MRVVCVYKENQDYSRTVDEWITNIYRQTGKQIETMNPDENQNFCEAYDIVEYPTVLALGEQGDIKASWRGQSLPLINDVLYYMV